MSQSNINLAGIMEIKTTFGALVAAFGLSTLSPVATAATTTFDSAAEFSLSQGQGGWEYGYYSSAGVASTFSEMTTATAATSTSAAKWSGGGQWTELWADGGHPTGANSGAAIDAVRRWTVGADGTLTVSGTDGMLDVGSTSVSVLLNGVSVYSQTLLPNTSGVAQNFSFTEAVHVGDKLDFVINSNGVDSYDSTLFKATGTIAASVPEPETYAMLVAGLGVIGLLIRRRNPA